MYIKTFKIYKIYNRCFIYIIKHKIKIKCIKLFFIKFIYNIVQILKKKIIIYFLKKIMIYFLKNI